METPKMIPTDILITLERDYENFPHQQTFSIYHPEVYFKDPLTEFRGLPRYQKMIQFLDLWFQAIDLQLHAMEQQDNLIKTRWTLAWTSPLPWKPRIVISGRSELTVNDQNLIISHIDYWDCSRGNVFKQHFFQNKTAF